MDFQPAPGSASGLGITEADVASLTADLALKAPLASPALTGTPTAPSAAQGTNTTQVATTAMVHSEAVLLAPIASPTLTGTPVAPTAAQGTSTTQLATTAMVQSEVTLLAPKASPALTGTPTVPTAAQGTSTTQAASTAMVQSEVTLLAPKASPTLTGTPVAPTAAVDTNTTQLATTAYVVGQTYAKLASPALTGSPTVPTQTAQDNSTKAASTVYVDRSTREAQEMKNRGFLAWNGPVHQTQAGLILVSQSLYVLRIPVLETISVTNICVNINTAGNTLTSSQNLLTLYNQAGTKQGDTADQSAVWTTAGYYIKPVTGGPFSITGGPTSYCWVSVLSNGTTPAVFSRNTTAAACANAGGAGALTTTAMWAARNGTAVTSTADLTLASNVATAAIDIWVGLS